MGLKSQKGLCLQDTLEDDQPLQSCKNQKLNETYLKSMFDWDSAESSVAQEVT